MYTVAGEGVKRKFLNRRAQYYYYYNDVRNTANIMLRAASICHIVIIHRYTHLYIVHNTVIMRVHGLPCTWTKNPARRVYPSNIW